MRFLHVDFGPVREFLSSNNCRITRLEWDLHPIGSGYASLPWTLKRRDAMPPQDVDIGVIATLFDQSGTAGGATAVLAQYFHVNRPQSDHPVSLSGAVEHVEAFGAQNEFLLAGHPDGGLISVSRWPLPFQDSAVRAEGWGP